MTIRPNSQKKSLITDKATCMSAKDFREIKEKLQLTKMLVGVGGFAKVLEHAKKSSDTNNPIKTNFIIKIFNNISTTDTRGVNNGLEIQVLEDLAKFYEGYSPYLHHVTLDFGGHVQDSKIMAVIMAYFDYDLSDLIYFFMDIAASKGRKKEVFLDNRFIKKKMGFYNTFYSQFFNISQSYIHESIIELRVLADQAELPNFLHD